MRGFSIALAVAVLSSATVAPCQGNVQIIGFGCPGTFRDPITNVHLAPFILPQGPPQLGATFTVAVTNLPLNVVFLALSFARMGPIDFAAFGMWGHDCCDLPSQPPPGCLCTRCNWYVQPDFGLLLAGANGVANFALQIPQDPHLLGLSFYEQALVFDTPTDLLNPWPLGVNPMGAVVSDALQVTL